MARDDELLKHFLVADYNLRKNMEYGYFISWCLHYADLKRVKESINGRYILLNDDWTLPADDDLVENMFNVSQRIQAHNLLFFCVAVFESVLKYFYDRLMELNKMPQKYTVNPYKSRIYLSKLLWLREEIVSLRFSNNKMDRRAINDFVLIDEARRIRNLFLHQRGFMDDKYDEQTIDILGKSKRREEYYEYLNNKKTTVLIRFDFEEFVTISRAHYDMLHIFYNKLCRKYINRKQKRHSYRHDGIAS